MKNQSFTIDTPHGKPILADVTFNTKPKQPIIVFAHGFKGFKDWGAWHLVAQKCVEAGFIFVKFNFSHNGGTLENPIDFPDTKAFGDNTLSLELSDLNTVNDWLCDDENLLSEFINPNKIHVIGHSRGGGIAILAASMDQRINKLCTWASVSDFYSRLPSGNILAQWKETGVMHIENARTKQLLPMNISYYNDLMENDYLDLKTAAKKTQQPWLILHGDEDTVVKVAEAKQLHEWGSNSIIYTVEDGNHTFGVKHPHKEKQMPSPMKEIVKRSIAFFKKK